MTTIKANGKDWKALLGSAKVYVDEATIRVNDGKARILAVSTTRENMIYGEIDCEGEAEFSVVLEKMIKALSAVDGDAEIEVGDGVLTIYGQSSKIKVPLIVADTCPDWPEKFMTPTSYCDVPPSLLDPILSYGKYCNQSVVKISIADTKMRFEIYNEYGQDTSEVESPNTAVGEVEATFSLTFIDTIIKHTKSCETVTIGGFADNTPMVVSWQEGTGKFRVLIAPRIED